MDQANGGQSSLSIVPLAVASAANCAFVDTPDSVTVKVSFASSVESCAVATVNVAVVWLVLALKVSVPVAADRSVKSPVSAVSSVSSDAVQVTVTSAAAASDSVTVNSTALPSSAFASATLSVGRAVSAGRISAGSLPLALTNS